VILAVTLNDEQEVPNVQWATPACHHWV